MKGSELIKKVELCGQKRGVAVRFVPRRGKGSHGTLFYAAEFAVVPDVKKELKTGTLHGILRRLGIEKAEL